MSHTKSHMRKCLVHLGNTDLSIRSNWEKASSGSVEASPRPPVRGRPSAHVTEKYLSHTWLCAPFVLQQNGLLWGPPSCEDAPNPSGKGR